jgi:hypothetical protein
VEYDETPNRQERMERDFVEWRLALATAVLWTLGEAPETELTARRASFETRLPGADDETLEKLVALAFEARDRTLSVHLEARRGVYEAEVARLLALIEREMIGRHAPIGIRKPTARKDL